jgi:hypothetical protein
MTIYYTKISESKRFKYGAGFEKCSLCAEKKFSGKIS